MRADNIELEYEAPKSKDFDEGIVAIMLNYGRQYRRGCDWFLNCGGLN